MKFKFAKKPYVISMGLANIKLPVMLNYQFINGFIDYAKAWADADVLSTLGMWSDLYTPLSKTLKFEYKFEKDHMTIKISGDEDLFAKLQEHITHVELLEDI